MKRFNNLRHLRELKGYSQKYVGSRIGKSQAALSKMENGYTYIPEKTVLQLSEILEVKKETIFEDEKQFFQHLNDSGDDLLNQLSQNNKLLHDVELNQEKLQKQLDIILSKASEKG